MRYNFSKRHITRPHTGRSSRLSLNLPNRRMLKTDGGTLVLIRTVRHNTHNTRFSYTRNSNSSSRVVNLRIFLLLV